MADARPLQVVLVEDEGLADAVRDRVPGTAVMVVETGGEALGEALVEADAFVCYRLAPEDTARATRLRLVQALSAGADWVDRAALPAGCTLCNVYEHETAIAEWVLMAMLALTRRLVIYDRDLRRGRWHRHVDAFPLERELAGRTVGTIGFGHIGRRVVELGVAVGMEAIAVTRAPVHERAAAGGVRWLGALGDLRRLLTEADFAVVCVPRAAETIGLIGAAELEALGPQGYLLNVARGEIVQEQALYEALRANTIAGAAIDVWYRYPSRDGDPTTQPSEFPFAELDNVVMTPHVSGHTRETDEGRRRFVAEQIARLAEGRPLENVLASGAPAGR